MDVGERVWPNLGGERVVNVNKRKSKPPGDDDWRKPIRFDGVAGALGEFSSRRLLLGLLISGAATQLAGPRKPVPLAPPSDLVDEGDLGDAVTSPALETQFIALATSGGDAYALDPLISRLEAYGGSQLFASSGRGRWVLPWVGGWERLYASQGDATFLGGPAVDSLRLATDKTRSAPLLSAGADVFSQVSARHFVYGPGAGGINIEYLYAAPGVEGKLLLTRQGVVNNLGGNYFQLDFPQSLEAYQVHSANGVDVLASKEPLQGSVGGGAPVEGLVMVTTYLSERLWVLRDEAQRIAVFQRTETRSVMDRRGLVAEGQLKPPEDESIRYGGLLFGETLQDYQGWEDKAKEDARKDELLRR